MTFIKFLRIIRKNKAQTSLEYFIILTVVVLLVITFGLNTFLPRIRQTSENVFNGCAERIIDADRSSLLEDLSDPIGAIRDFLSTLSIH